MQTLTLSALYTRPLTNPSFNPQQFHIYDLINNSQPFKVLIKIFTISGKLIKSISTLVNTFGNLKSEPIPWDGMDDFGDKIGRGVYIYQIDIETQSGMNANKIEKLVIIR